MSYFFIRFGLALGAAGIWCLALAWVLVGLGKLGRAGRGVTDVISRAPALDVVVALLTWIPWAVALYFGSWQALLGSIAGEWIALQLWTAGHEWLNREVNQGPRIVKVLNRLVGRWRNYTALWVTLIALPGFWLIRLHEILVYPFLILLLKFPRYRQGDWINVSRQKFEGLIGHDLIWCLYCDWMTGVYSLGGEMLRNVESFWCPIRFYNGKKCDNCRIDFPDVAGGWVAADGSMADIEKALLEHYADGRREWFGHPARLTVRGAPLSQKTE